MDMKRRNPRNREDLVEVFKMYKGFTKMDISELFTNDSNVQGTRGHILKLKKPVCNRDIRKYFFSHMVVGRWNSLDQEMVDALNINAFKGRHDTIRQTRVGFFMD